MKDKLVNITEFSKLTGLSRSTLLRMQSTKTLVPAFISDGGHRFYKLSQLSELSLIPETKRRSIGYCRVSTNSQKNDLLRQIENVKTYMIAKGYEFDIITDIGSGINYKKPGLRELIEKIQNKEVDKLVVLYKNRLLRFGFEIIEYLCELNGTELIVIDSSERTKEEELTEDLLQIITVFANRLYGSKSKKTKRLIDEVKSNES